jgi:hypothetical protein
VQPSNEVRTLHTKGVSSVKGATALFPNEDARVHMRVFVQMASCESERRENLNGRKKKSEE